MKKILSTLCMALTAVVMMAQQPVITFEKTEHDFGKINESDGRVSTEFVFKNEGMSPLVLSNVRASCGCTTPTWTKEPIEPGQSGSITVTYNPNGRPGRFQKTITITSNASEATKRVYIKGEVIPKQAKPVNKYTIAVGELSMQKKVLDLGVMTKGESRSGELEYANQSSSEHSVELATNAADNYLISEVTLPVAKANEVGKFMLVIDSKLTKLYGDVKADAYVVIDGKRMIDDEHKITVKANIVEDFSKLTIEEKQQSPLIETAGELNLGQIASGKVLKGKLEVKNIGVNPLEVRRAYSFDEAVNCRAPKAVKSGKKGVIAIDVNTRGMEKGSYSRELIIITNDYQTPVKKVNLTWTVQ